MNGWYSLIPGIPSEGIRRGFNYEIVQLKSGLENRVIFIFTEIDSATTKFADFGVFVYVRLVFTQLRLAPPRLAYLCLVSPNPI